MLGTRSILSLSSFALLAAVPCGWGWPFPLFSNRPSEKDLVSECRSEIALHMDASQAEWRERISFVPANGNAVTLIGRSVFSLRQGLSPDAVFLALEKPVQWQAVELNGKPVPRPLDVLRHDRIDGVAVAMVSGSNNVLTFRRVIQPTPASDGSFQRIEVHSAELNVRIFEQRDRDLLLQSGPVLGYADTNLFTVSFRANMPCRGLLEVAGNVRTSEVAIIHSFTASNLMPSTTYSYMIGVESAGGFARVWSGRNEVSTLPGDDGISFVLCGDCRSRPELWRRICEALLKRKPSFILISGDLVGNGLDSGLWDREFFKPASALCAAFPLLVVPGNHDADTPLLGRMFQTPGGQTNWVFRAGPATFVGINGGMGWEKDPALVEWLDGVLSAARTPYVFVMNHYPPWTSSYHGALIDGVPAERQVRISRDVIVPVLEKHRVTAYLCGHTHAYERSEKPGSVTVIVSGGAGAPMHSGRADPEGHNPYAVIYAEVLHYCEFNVSPESCEMNVLDLDGNVIDTRAWPPRL